MAFTQWPSSLVTEPHHHHHHHHHYHYHYHHHRTHTHTWKTSNISCYYSPSAHYVFSWKIRIIEGRLLCSRVNIYGIWALLFKCLHHSRLMAAAMAGITVYHVRLNSTSPRHCRLRGMIHVSHWNGLISGRLTTVNIIIKDCAASKLDAELKYYICIYICMYIPYTVLL